MEIPYTEFRPETLRAMIEAFVAREGTDYGAQEISFEAKVESVNQQLKSGRAIVVYDSASESCDIREKKSV